ncbi:MAG: hypothetical protein PHI40_07665 [Caldisericia bacterium]|nr:hypothetical protein [Caldisericia bacterium]
MKKLCVAVYVCFLLISMMMFGFTSCSNQQAFIQPEKVAVTIVEEQPILLLEDPTKSYIVDRTYEYSTRCVSSPIQMYYKSPIKITEEKFDEIYDSAHISQDIFFLHTCTPTLAKKWERVLNLHPNYTPIYQMENGNIYFAGTNINVQTPNTTASYEIFWYNDEYKLRGSLILLNQHGLELPLSEDESITSSECSIVYCDKNNPWIVLKVNQETEDGYEEYTVLMNLETQKVYPLQEPKTPISNLYSFDHGCVLESVLPNQIQSEERTSEEAEYIATEFKDLTGNEEQVYSIFCRNVYPKTHQSSYSYFDFSEKTLRPLSPPTETSMIVMSPGNRSVLWYDTKTHDVYVQNSMKEKPEKILQDFPLYSIYPSIGNTYWMIPEPYIGSTDTLYFLALENDSISLQELQLPSQFEATTGVYVDEQGRLNWLEQDKVVLNVIYPDTPETLHRYPLESKIPIRSLSLGEYVDSLDGRQRVVLHINIDITEENKHLYYHEEKNKTSSSSYMIADPWVHELFQYSLP